MSKFVDNVGLKFSFSYLRYEGCKQAVFMRVTAIRIRGEFQEQLIPIMLQLEDGKTGTQRKEMPFQNYRVTNRVGTEVLGRALINFQLLSHSWSYLSL